MACIFCRAQDAGFEHSTSTLRQMMAEKMSVCFVLGVFYFFHSKTLRFMEINRKIS